MDVLWVGHYHKLFIPMSIGIACLVLLQHSWLLRLRLDALGLLLLLLIPFGTAVGMLGGGEPRFFISHLGAALLAFTVYTAAFNGRPDSRWLDGFLHFSSNLILIAYITSIGAFWIIRLVMGADLYFGIGTSDLALPLAYFLVKRRFRLAAIAVLLVLLSGKRGSILAAGAVLLFYISLPGAARFGTHVLSTTIFGLLLLFASFVAEPLLASLPIPEGVRSILDKWYLLNPFNPEFNPDLALSGRNQELILSFAAFNEHAHHFWVGMGFGWNYYFDALIPGSDTTDYVSHYVHVSPLNLLLTYGAPITAVFLLLIWRRVSRAYRLSMRLPGPEIMRVVLLYFVGAFVGSLSGYSFATDPFFWLALGTLSNIEQIKTASQSQDT